jgi:hypothetical protein
MLLSRPEWHLAAEMFDLGRLLLPPARVRGGQLSLLFELGTVSTVRQHRRMSSIDERIVAALHDVCEDCPGWTFDRLRREGFSPRIIDALQSVTKRDGEGYEDFVRRAAANPIGRCVKLADLHDNSDLSRIAAPSERDFQRIEKYQRAIDLIRRLPA